MGGRFMMKGDLETEVPAFNTNFTALAKAWPELPEKLTISKSNRGTKDLCGTWSTRILAYSVAQD